MRLDLLLAFVFGEIKLSLLSPSEVLAEDIREYQIQEPPGEAVHPKIDMAELSSFNAK
ncbi:MAG TPA: hypothetical protein VGC17_01975 [Lactovum miscens]